MSKCQLCFSRMATAAGMCALVAFSLVSSGCATGDREAQYLGSRLCINNQSPVLLVVTFTKKDTSTGEGQVTPGAQVCAEGTFASGNSVEGTIGMPPPLSNKTFSSFNPFIGWPEVELKEDRSACLDLKGDVGRVAIHDDGVLRYRIERLPDDSWKEHVITIERSQKPSPSGIPTKCSGSGGGGGGGEPG